MIDAKQTLINLHSKFPSMSLDDLFTILECYVEQFGLTTWQPPAITTYTSTCEGSNWSRGKESDGVFSLLK